MILLITYHPSAILRAGGEKGFTRDGISRALKEDLLRAKTYLESGNPPLEAPQRGIPASPYVGVDTEYTKDKDVLTVALSDGVVVTSWDKDLGGVDPLGITQSVIALVGHNIPEDLSLLWEKGYIPKKEEWLRGEHVYDSLLLGRMVYEGLPSYKLEDLLATQYLVRGWKRHTRGREVGEWTPEERVERCERDAWAPVHLVKAFYPQLDTTHRTSLYPFTMALAMTLHRLTLAGAFVDREKFHSLVEELSVLRGDAAHVLTQAANLVGVPAYSPHNDGQTRRLLYERLGLPVLEVTEKTKVPKVSKEVLDLLMEYAEGGVKRFLEALREYNRLDKLLTTYLVGGREGNGENAIATLGFPVNIGVPVWYLPFHFHVLGAKTARRASSRPNSQNWPAQIRALVRSRWMGGFILAADYRKLEPRIVAWLAGDDQLLSYFTTGEGYVGLARDLLRTEVKEGTPLYRGVKSIVLGVHYNMHTDEMARQLWTHHRIRFSEDYRKHWQETDRIRNLYLDSHPRLAEYMARRVEEVQRTGHVRTPTGRLRRVGRFMDKHVVNQAINAPVQGTASDVTGAALIDVERAILAEYRLSLTEWHEALLAGRRKCLTNGLEYGIFQATPRIPTLFNEVHDELTVDLPPERVERHVELVVETMRAVPTLRQLAPSLKGLPLDVDPKVGPYWGTERI